MISTRQRPHIADEVVHAGREQPLEETSWGWRWGPLWELPPDRSGTWAIHQIFHVAVRVEWGSSVGVTGSREFEGRLDEARLAEDRAAGDAYLAQVNEADARSEKASSSQRQRRERERLRRDVAAGVIGGPVDGQEVKAR